MARQPRKSPRNPLIGTTGVRRFSRSAVRRKRADYLHASKGDTRTPEQKAEAEKKRAAAATASTSHLNSRFYAADDVKIPLRSNKQPGQPKLRKSLTPGTVVIILAGRFRGKRVVLLKQLQSGLLLVTGPYKINGVPLRRVNAAYVLATSTKVDVSAVDVGKVEDSLFLSSDKAGKAKGSKKKDAEFISDDKKQRPVISSERKAEQQRVDAALTAAIKPVANLQHYLHAKFSLTKGQKPHLLSF